MTCQYHKINYISLGLGTKTKELHELKDLLLSRKKIA